MEAERLFERSSITVVRQATAVAWVVFILLSVALALEAPSGWIQRVDDVVLDGAVALENGVFTVLAAVLRFVGSAWVTVPLVIAVAVILLGTGRTRMLAFWLPATVGAQILVHATKWLYGRERPPDAILSSVGDSYPSGHATTASSIAIALVLVFVPPGRRRWAWWAVVLYTVVMSLSRIYLRAHWLSDVIGGAALGTATVLTVALLVQERTREAGDARQTAP